MSSADLMPNLKEFIQDFQLEETQEVFISPCEHFSYRSIPLTDDLNKEIGHDKFFGIRSDDDFFIEAVLPKEYENLTLEELSKTLWPDREFEFRPDTVYQGD